MKEIALIKIGEKTPPLGLLYLGNALKNAGYEPQIYHIKKREIYRYAKKIVDINPLFVGFSVITGMQTKLSAIMSKEIKKRSNIKIFWGGPHPTLVSEQCLKESYVDGVVFGEGEETVVDIARSIEKNIPLEKVKGIGFKKGNKIIITKPRKFITNLDKHRMDWSLIDIKKYLGKEKLWGCKRVLPYVTSRGCPYNCAFCYNLIFNKRIWRCHSVKHVVEDIQFLKDTYNIDGIKIFDDNFFVNMKRAFNIIEAIKLPWHCELRADVVTKKVAKKLQQTNAKELLIGAETGSERLMQLINKGLTVNTVMKCVKNLSKIDAFPVYSFIVGLPTETWEETQLTIDMILKIHEIDPKAMFTVGPFNPYPNNPLYDLAIKLGFKPPEKTEDWSIIERWEGNFDLTWLPWGDKKLFLLIRDYSKFLYFGTNYNIPFLERIAKYRLSRRNFSFTLEHKLIKLAYKNFRELI